MLRRSLGLAVLLAFAVMPPGDAAELRRQAQFDAEPARVWAVIGDFCGIARWHPAVMRCAADGARRTLTLPDGGPLIERLLERDEVRMQYAYTMEAGPLPVSDDFRATLLVTDQGDRTLVTWRAEFTAAAGHTDAQATLVIDQFFAAGLEGLGRRLAE